MRRFNGLAGNHGGFVRVCAVGIGVTVLVFAVGTGVAASAGVRATKLCVPKAAGKPVKTPTSKGRCPRKYKLVEFGGSGNGGGVGPLEALQYSVNAGGVFTGGQVVGVPAGSYGSEQVAPETTVSYGPISFPAQGVVAEIHVSGKEGLGEAMADVHVSNLAGTQIVGGVTGKVILKGKLALLELTHIAFQAGTDLYLKEGKLYSANGGTYWVKVGISLPRR